MTQGVAQPQKLPRARRGRRHARRRYRPRRRSGGHKAPLESREHAAKLPALHALHELLHLHELLEQAVDILYLNASTGRDAVAGASRR